MSVQVEYIDNSHIRVNCEIAPEVLRTELHRIFGQLKKAGRIRISGFRTNKLTYEVARQMYGHGFLMQDAIPSAVYRFCDEVLLQEYVVPVGNVKVDSIDTDAAMDGKAFACSFSAEIEPTAELATCDVKIPAIPRVASEAEVSKYIEGEQLNNARYITVEDRGAENGDFVTMDYEFFIDGQKVEDSVGKDVRVELGVETIFPGFNEHLTGVKAGDHRDFAVASPEDISNPALKGKELAFSVDVKLVQRRELPELDDEFAQDVSECETFEEYMNQVKDKLTEKKLQNLDSVRGNAAITSLIAGAKMDISDEVASRHAEAEMKRVESICEENKLSKEVYAQYILGIPVEMLPQYVEMTARNNLTRELALRAAAKALSLNPTDEEYKEQLAREAENLKVSVADMEYLYPAAHRLIVDMLRISKAEKYVIEHAEEVEGYVIPQPGAEENGSEQ